MDAKERIRKAMHQEPTDRPPCICPGGMMNMITTDLMDEANVSWPEAHLNAASGISSGKTAKLRCSRCSAISVPFVKMRSGAPKKTLPVPAKRTAPHLRFEENEILDSGTSSR